MKAIRLYKPGNHGLRFSLIALIFFLIIPTMSVMIHAEYDSFPIDEDIAEESFDCSLPDMDTTDTTVGTPECDMTLDEIRLYRFSDVSEENPFKDAISYTAYCGQFLGCAWNCFYPESPLTQEQIITVLQRAIKKMNAEDSSDLPLQWMADAGITRVADIEANDNNAYITRAQLASLLYCFSHYAGYDTECTGDLSALWDGTSVSETARIPVSWAIEHHIFETVTANMFCPNLAVSREQTAAIMTALAANLDNKPIAYEIVNSMPNLTLMSKSRSSHEGQRAS